MSKVVIAIYTRKSRLTDKGNSIENQIQYCKEYAQKHFSDISDYKVYIDDGFSGGNTLRPQFQRMLSDAKNKVFNVLMSYKLDRISRSVADYARTYELLSRYDIEFIVVKENFDTTTPYGRLSMNISAVMAQFERELIAERIRDNAYLNAKSGNWTGGKAPLGYTNIRTSYKNGRGQIKKHTILKIVPEEKTIIETLYNKYLEELSIRQLLKFVTCNDILTKQKQNFCESSLLDILRNPTYCIADEKLYKYLEKQNVEICNSISEFDGKRALYVHNRVNKSNNKNNPPSEWFVALGQHEGIISSDLWVNVQYILNKNAQKKPRESTGAVGLLTGLIKCGKCNSTMRVRKGPLAADGTRLYYYSCHLKDISASSKCNINNLIGHVLDDQVLDYLTQLADKELYAKSKINKDDLNFALKVKSRLDEEIIIERENEIIKKKIHKLIDELSQAEDEINKKFIKESITQLGKKSEAYENKINEIKIKASYIEESQSSFELVKEALKNITAINKFDDTTLKRLILKIIINKIVWDGSKIKIILNS